MTTETLTSKAGLKTAGGGTVAGLAAAWFLGVVLTASVEVVVGAIVVAAVTAAVSLARFLLGEVPNGD